MKKNKINKILSLVAICTNVLLVFKPLYLFYTYNFTCRMFLYRVPYWMLLSEALLALGGIYVSILLYKNVISIKFFSIATLALWFVVMFVYSGCSVENLLSIIKHLLGMS